MLEKLFDLTKIGEGSCVLSRPTAYKGALYFGSLERFIYSLNADTGEENWRFLTGGVVATSSLVHDDILYQGSLDQKLYALDLDGKKLWEKDMGGMITTSCVINNNIIYFGTSNGYFYAMNLDGKVIWKFRAGDQIFTDPKIFNNRIYFGSCDNHFYCIDMNGSLIWKYRIGGPVSTWDQTALYKGKLYFGSADEYIYCLTTDGKLVWRKKTGDMIFSTPRIADNKVLLAGRDGNFYALDVNTGKTLWIFKFYTAAYSTAVINNNAIYFGSAYPRNKLFALNMEGHKLWSFQANEGVGAPEFYNNMIYFGCWDGHIYCVSTKGKQIWKVRTGSGKMADVSKIVPPPKIQPDAFAGMIANQLKLEKPFATTYEKNVPTFSDTVSNVEYTGIVKEYASFGKTGYERASNEEKDREIALKKKREDWMRREHRM